jgi:hypothetical protein
MNTEPQRTTDRHHLIRSTEAMLDYAIVAGAELRNPMLVRFVQLARRALLDQEQPDTPGKETPNQGGKQ